MAAKGLTWDGKKVTAKLRRAMAKGVNQTMAEAVEHAKNNHDWQNRSGILEGSIGVAEYARPGTTAEPVRGTWGSAGVRYALIHELGGTIVPTRASALAIPQPDGSVRLVKSVTIPARPYLRPAADAEYPHLARRIRKAFEGGTT